MPSLRLNSSNGPREIGCAIQSLSDCARTRILEAWSRSKPASLEFLPFSGIQKQSGNHVPQADLSVLMIRCRRAPWRFGIRPDASPGKPSFRLDHARDLDVADLPAIDFVRHNASCC